MHEHDGNRLAAQSSPPRWHRAVYALAAAPFLFAALMGWHEGAYLQFLIPALLCIILSLRPMRLGAVLLFWFFAAATVVYGWLLVKDLMTMTEGGAPGILVDAGDSIVFVALELVLVMLSVAFFFVWRPFGARPPARSH